MVFATCPRCQAGVAPAPDIGADVGRCDGCGCWLCAGAARAHLTRWLTIDEAVWDELVRQGRGGPRCTLCPRGFKTFSLKGVVVDGCVGCGALLLDPGELARLTGLPEAPPPSPPPAPPIASATPVVLDAGLGRVYAAPDVALANFLGGARWLQLEQERQFGEQLLSVEFGNRYAVRGPAGSGSLVVDEGAAAALVRMFLGGLLRSRYVLRDGRDTPVLSLRRSFHRLVLSRLDVSLWAGDDDGRLLGRVERNLRMLASSYDLVDAQGRRFARLERPFTSMWQFRLLDEGGQSVGAIAKQWSGFVTEWFSDADDYGVDFGERDWSLEQRAVILAAALVIDLDHFENRGGRANRSLFD
jgi:hypothetical protein